ncbi:MAG: precorrin-6Y C5,15-methyltransferase (decarboxylating) subunit CbiT [Methanomicrobiales archaeon]|nr:precorrin-6Y C5,15-methyltransferase (decarboxylating) subunit CbiT [Methanomicrobiales archaeon]
MVKLRGAPTQDEVMAVALLKLRLKAGDIFADIGCGSGKVSIAASSQAGRVFAVDRHPEAILQATEGARRCGIKNITFVEAEALDFLRQSDSLDAAFVGGSKNLPEVLHVLAGKTRGRIVVNAVLLRTLHGAISVMKEIGIFREALQIQISRSQEIGGDLMFRPIDPIFMIVGEGRC